VTAAAVLTEGMALPLTPSLPKSLGTDPVATEILRSEIEAIIARHVTTATGYETPVPGLHVGRLTTPLPPTTHIAEASVCVGVRGARKLILGEAGFVQLEGDYLLSTVGLPTIVTIPDVSEDKPYTALRIDIDLDLARQIMAEIDVDSAPATHSETGLSFGRVDPDFLDAVARLVRLIETPQHVAYMSGLLHREILYRLLTGASGHRLRQIVRFGSQGHRVARATNWLRAHFREPLKIDALARIAGMGVSTLHRHFHELTGMSPLQYQKQLRLHEARRLMLDGNSDVGTAALAVGYESSTQFIREYRRLFGEPPLRDIKALRVRGGPLEIL
jgi:AraC-like DNA-binding protein